MMWVVIRRGPAFWPLLYILYYLFYSNYVIMLVNFNGDFWAAVRKTVRPMLSDRCNVCPVCL